MKVSTMAHFIFLAELLTVCDAHRLAAPRERGITVTSDLLAFSHAEATSELSP